VDKNNVTAPTTSPFQTPYSQEGLGESASHTDQPLSSLPSGEVPTEDPQSGSEHLGRGKTDKDRISLENPQGKRSRADEGAVGVDWTTRITLALLLAGILLLGYVVFL
jgi:hypothetical protein